MKKFFIITNQMKDPGQKITGYIVDFLRSKGAVAGYFIRDEITGFVPVPQDAECILVLGGDGTLLQAARDTLSLGIPLAGVNLGTLGFLAEIEKSGIDDALIHLLNDEYEIEDRMLLSGSLWKGGEQVFEGQALNDIVVSRRGPLMVLPVDLQVNGQMLASYKADGIIVSTPTGSTGYNLSAGGPIVSPKARLMVVTPICPHTLNTRSVILSAEDEVTIFMKDPEDKAGENFAEVNFDGGLPGQVAMGEKLVIKQSGLSVKFIKISSESFLKLLHNRLK